MHKEKFDELWNKTVNTVQYGLSAKDIKGKAQINEYLHRIIWDHAWGNQKLIPPERKLLNDMSKENPKKVKEIESVLSNITIGYSWKLYTGIVIVLAGIITLFIAQGVWKIAAGIVGFLGIALALSDALRGNINPQKAALDALEKAKKQCDKILF